MRRGWRGADWLILALLAACLAALGASAQDDGDALSVGEARVYMLGLINRDRAAAGLPPVALDETATAAAQSHADEMAAHQYMAHYDLAGRTPDQRYTECGGTGMVQENAYLQSRRQRGSAAGALQPVAEPVFARRELEEIEAAYFNEVPPHDGHRRNILDGAHTHVGIGLARAQGDGTRTLANAQEFVNRWLALEPLPARARAGADLRVAGVTPAGITLRSITVARAPLPAPRTPAELDRLRGYSPPRASAVFADEPGASAPGSRFRVPIELPDGGRPGVYYVSIWVTPARGRPFIASRRTVLIEDAPARPAPARASMEPLP